MNSEEKQVRALEVIARELHRIGQSVEQLEKHFAPAKLLISDELNKFVNPFAEKEPNVVAVCGCTNLECVFCNPGACDHRFVKEGGGNG